MPPRVGAHMSIAGGMRRSVQRALDAGCEALQVFTKNNNQWRGKPLDQDDVDAFRAGIETGSLQPVIAHDSYLINVASPDDDLWRKSTAALDDELTRCERLLIPLLVMHPGAHVGSGETAAFERISAALNEIHAAHPESATTILLENTAGQGSNVGYEFEHLAEIFARLEHPERVGVCIDTAHLYASGYDIGTARGWDLTWDAFERCVGFGKLAALHVNDSKKPLGSRVDRHEHIGLGLIPAAAFVALMNDARFEGLPAVLETPKTDKGTEDRQNLAVLRRMVGRKRAPSVEEITAWRRKVVDASAASPSRGAAASSGARSALRKRPSRPEAGSR